MQKIQQTVYITVDGARYLNESDAIKHETNIKNIRHFVVYHCPDLNETGNYTKKMHIAVHSPYSCHKQIVYQYLMKHLGWNAIQEGVMGYGYMASFTVEEITYEEYCKEKHDKKFFLSQISVKGYPINFNFVEDWKEIIPKA